MKYKYIIPILALFVACKQNKNINDKKVETVGTSIYEGPIIDMHIHSSSFDINGPMPVAFCYPISTIIPHLDPDEGAMNVFMDKMTNPDCDDPIWSPKSDEEFLERIILQLEKYNVTAIASGSSKIAKQWNEKSNGKILPSIAFDLKEGLISLDSIKLLIDKYKFIGIGEVANQYEGIGVDDKQMNPYYELAQELDIPIGIHMGSGAPGSPMTITPNYEVHLSNPLHLEKVLKKYPKLRVYVMHYGEPFIDEMIAMMYHYPQLYVDIGGIQLTYPKTYFYEYHLKKLISAGFGKRIMHGSDAMVWPELIGKSIDIINQADFLSHEQKADILYNNAARFLRMK
jgi:predicted TIM-barrel fold metal-dependent hydrolase